MRLRRAIGCWRWERALYLSVSETLGRGAGRALRGHLAACPDCRAEHERAARLWRECQEVAGRRKSLPGGLGLWPSIEAAMSESIPLPAAGSDPARRPEAPLSVPACVPASVRVRDRLPDRSGRRATIARGRYRVGVTALLLFFLVGVSWFTIETLFRDFGAGPGSAAALEAKWAARWDDFVSNSDGRRDAPLDPFTPVIPHPDPIAF